MTQEELKAKLNDYDLKGATMEELISDRDSARDMYAKCSNMHSAIYDAVRGADDEPYGERPTREVDDATTELLSAIRLEAEIYYLHASRLGVELVERLSKMDNN